MLVSVESMIVVVLASAVLEMYGEGEGDGEERVGRRTRTR